MRLEWAGQSYQSGSTSSAYLPETPVFHQSGSEDDAPNLLKESPSLGVSSLSFVRMLKMTAMAVAFGSSIAVCSDSALAKALCPEHFAIADNSMMAAEVGRPVPAPSFEQRERQRQLVAIIKSAPVEDGVLHPAEEPLAKFLRQHGSIDLLRQVFAERPQNNNLTSAVIRLLGRVDSIDAQLKATVLRSGLASASVEIRDATVQAAETWGDASAVALLRTHRETSPWLADYINRVVRDLGG